MSVVGEGHGTRGRAPVPAVRSRGIQGMCLCMRVSLFVCEGWVGEKEGEQFCLPSISPSALWLVGKNICGKR